MSDGLTLKELLEFGTLQRLRADADTHPVGANATQTIHAECPECGRTEQVTGLWQGHAWLLGHLQAEHAAALPAFEGVAEEDDA